MNVSIEILVEAGRYLTPKHYHEVLIERQVLAYCGYPSCEGKLSYKVKRKKSAALMNQPSLSTFDVEDDDLNSQQEGESKTTGAMRNTGLISKEESVYYFCSSKCHVASEYYVSQLSFDPMYMRNLSRPSHIDILSLTPAQLVGLDTGFSDLVIHEKESPSVASDLPLQKEFHDDQTHMVEGYVIPHIEPIVRQGEKSTLANKAGKNVRSTASRTEKHDCESDVSAVQEESAESETNERWLKPSKKKHIPALSLFGSFWTFLDKLVTSETKSLLRHDNAFFDTLDVHTFMTKQQDSILAERRKIFIEKIMQTMNMIKQDYSIARPLEDCLIPLILTLNLDVKSTMLNALEIHGLCTVFLRM